MVDETKYPLSCGNLSMHFYILQEIDHSHLKNATLMNMSMNSDGF